eukprot:2118976-Rhodomonas_salina.1
MYRPTHAIYRPTFSVSPYRLATTSAVLTTALICTTRVEQSDPLPGQVRPGGGEGRGSDARNAAQ